MTDSGSAVIRVALFHIDELVNTRVVIEFVSEMENGHRNVTEVDDYEAV